ncbi:hypothetical protein ACFSTC_37990 [Nonomuraea ferruginea]
MNAAFPQKVVLRKRAQPIEAGAFEAGGGDAAIGQVEIDQGGGGQVQAHALPEGGRGRRHRVLVGGPVVTYMGSQDALRREPHLQFALLITLPCRTGWAQRRWLPGGRPGSGAGPPARRLCAPASGRAQGQAAA